MTGLVVAAAQGDVVPGFWQTAEAIGSVVEAVLTSAGIVIAGVWAYYRFGKDRPYRPRFALDLEAGRLDGDAAATLLLVRASVTNLGATTIDFEVDRLWLRMRLPKDASPGEQRSVKWNESGYKYAVLREHEWIESGETISHDEVIQLPQEVGPVVLLELRVITATRRLRPGWRDGRLSLWRRGTVGVYTREVISTKAVWSAPVDRDTDAGDGT